MEIKTAQIPPTLAAALIRAQKRITGLGKHARNEQQGYDYTSSEDLIAVGGQAMNAEGVGIIPIETGMSGPWESHKQETRGGMKEYLVAPVRRVFAVFHEGGEAILTAIEVPAVQSAGRPADKAVLATHTESLGYLIRDLLTVARGEDKFNIRTRDDGDAGEDINGRGESAEKGRAGVESRSQPRGTHPVANAGTPRTDQQITPEAARTSLIAMAKEKRMYGTAKGQIDEDFIKDWDVPTMEKAYKRLQDL